MSTMETGSHWLAEAEEVDDWAAWADTDSDDEHAHAHAGVASRIKEGTRRKRLYEPRKGETDREIDKMYKRDYWEDPSYASLLELCGLVLARGDAVLCYSYRARMASDAMVAERRKERERRKTRAPDEPEPEPEPEPPMAAAGEGRHFLCFLRSIVDNLAAKLHYFLG